MARIESMERQAEKDRDAKLAQVEGIRRLNQQQR